MLLVVHDTSWNVVSAEHRVVTQSTAICGCPEELWCTWPKLRLFHVKPVVSLKRVYRLGKHQRVCRLEVKVGGILWLLVVLRVSYWALINFC
jgi:hypothetical protein